MICCLPHPVIVVSFLQTSGCSRFLFGPGQWAFEGRIRRGSRLQRKWRCHGRPVNSTDAGDLGRRRLRASFDSSVGRAEDCSGRSQASLGRWFESGSKEPTFLSPFFNSTLKTSIPVLYVLDWRLFKTLRIVQRIRSLIIILHNHDCYARPGFSPTVHSEPAPQTGPEPGPGGADPGGSGRIGADLGGPPGGIEVHRPRTRAGGGGPSARAGPGLVGHARPLPGRVRRRRKDFPGDPQRPAVGDQGPPHQPRPL